MKRLSTFICLIILFGSILFNNKISYATESDVNPAESYVLIDAETQQVLKGHNENEVMVPASTTKVMTAIIVLENTHLNNIVTVGEKPQYVEGTAIGLKKGDKYTVEDLMYGLLLESANDCAEALAEYVGGTRENFIKMMNDKAKELNLKDTHFVNPSGLWEDDNVTTNKTTAYELSLILKEALKYPDYIRISKKLNYKFPPLPGDTFEKWVNNRNELLFEKNSHYYKYASAGKAGYTRKSMHTFTASAEKDGRTLIVSVLKSPSKNSYFPLIKDLFEYGFNNTTNVKLYSKGDKIYDFKVDKNDIPLLSTKDIYYTINNSDYSKDDLDNIDSIKSSLSPSIMCNCNPKTETYKKGDEIATCSISIKDKKVVDNLPLISSQDAPKKGILQSKDKPSNNSDYKKYIYAIIIVIIIILLFNHFIKKRRKRRRKEILFSNTRYPNYL